jgi:hypothetical protein
MLSPGNDGIASFHGLGSIFGALFKAAVPLLKKGAKTLGRKAFSYIRKSLGVLEPFLTEDVFRCVP